MNLVKKDYKPALVRRKCGRIDSGIVEEELSLAVEEGVLLFRSKTSLVTCLAGSVGDVMEQRAPNLEKTWSTCLTSTYWMRYAARVKPLRSSVLSRVQPATGR